MTEQEREERRLEKYRKYNRSIKGAARYKKYEEAHPERQKNWSPIMHIKARI